MSQVRARLVNQRLRLLLLLILLWFILIIADCTIIVSLSLLLGEV